MKIAFCLPISISYWGGGEKWAATVARALKERGHKVEIHAMPYTPTGKRVVNSEEVLRRIDYCEQWLHRIDADVAYVFYHPLSWLIFRSTCPKIAGFHSGVYFIKTIPVSYGLIPLGARVLYKVIGGLDLKLWDAIHVPNKMFNPNHSYVAHIPNGVDSRVYRPRERENSKFTVLFVGKPTWQKGWDVFRRLASEFRHDPDIEFLLAGDKGSEFVRGLGFITDENVLAETYSKAHLLVSPARSDMAPLSIVESLSCGTPVITTPLKSHRTLDLPLFYAGTLEGFQTTVKNLHSLWKIRSEKYDRICRSSRESALKYDWKNIIPQLESLLENVVFGNFHKESNP